MVAHNDYAAYLVIDTGSGRHTPAKTPDDAVRIAREMTEGLAEGELCPTIDAETLRHARDLVEYLTVEKTYFCVTVNGEPYVKWETFKGS